MFIHAIPSQKKKIVLFCILFSSCAYLYAKFRCTLVKCFCPTHSSRGIDARITNRKNTFQKARSEYKMLENKTFENIFVFESNLKREDNDLFNFTLIWHSVLVTLISYFTRSPAHAHGHEFIRYVQLSNAFKFQKSAKNLQKIV